MTQKLPDSGVLKMSEIKENLEIVSSDPISLGDPLLRALANKKTGQIKLSDFYAANEVECLIKAGLDTNGKAIGYYQSFWGENDRPNLANQNIIGAYDGLDVTPNNFIFALSGNQPRTTFRAIVINNSIYYEADATSWVYDAGSNTTTWKWANAAGLVEGTIYELSMLIGPGTSAQPAPVAGTFPVNQGTDWKLVFEDDFSGGSLDLTKWKTALWYLENDAVQNPAGVTNYDLASGRLRIWPFQNTDGTWIRRDLNTFGKFAQAEGYWEIKCKMPNNYGIRLGFWLLNHDTDARPTIAAFHVLPGSTVASGWVDAANNCIDFSFAVQPATDGVWKLNTRYRDLLPARAAINLTSADHVFGIKKTSTKVQFFFDGNELASQDLLGPDTMTLNQYLVVSLDYVVEVAPGASTIQNNTAAFEVDYVRAWVPAAGSTDTTKTVLPSGYVAPFGQLSDDFPYLTFREEFNGGPDVDSAKWNKQMYNTANNGKNNIKVENSLLYMWPELPFASGTTDQNALIDTDGKFYQKYGYFEVRAKLPIGRGCWPAFWLYNHDLSGVRPEIDVFEAFSGGNINNDWANAALHPIRYAGSAWSKQMTMLSIFNSANTLGYVDLSADWHIYGVLWKRGVIQFFFDGKSIGAYLFPTTSTEMDMRMYMTIDLFLGGPSGQANTTETPTGQTNSLMVDWCRAWALKDGSTVVEGSLAPLPESDGGKPTSGNTTPVAKPIVAFVGNSTTWGYKSTVGGRVDIPYPLAFAQRQTRYDVRNHGINSTTTENWINGTNGVPQKFADFMAANTDFKYVCIDLGNLDQFDMTTTQYKTNLKAMITEVRKVAGRVPILISPFVTKFTGLPDFVQAMRDTGAETQTPFIDKYTWSKAIVDNNGGVLEDFVPDGIHPNDQMYIDGGAYISLQWDTTVLGMGTAPDSTGNPMPAVEAGHPYTYTLTFNEEFNGSQLDMNIWNDFIWWNEGGEKTGKPVNWQVSDGQLHIWPDDGFYPRTIDTDGKYYQTYGFFECEAKLPIGRGSWPAFWLYNHDGYMGDPEMRPEIDIMEAYSGGGPDTGQTWADANLHPIDYAATLWRKNPDLIGTIRMSEVLPTVDLSAGYHKYGCLWEADGVTFYFDGQKVGTKQMTDFFQIRMYLLLDIYFGSASGTPSDAETPKGITNAFAVRYVRAWKKN